MPAIADHVLAGSCCVRELRREALDPPVDRHVVDLDAPLGHELFDVPVGETKPEYQRTARVMTSGGKRKPVKLERGGGKG